MVSNQRRDPSDRLGTLITVVSFERQELVSELLTEADLKTLKHLARKGTPENSLRALTSDLAYLEAWCWTATGTVLPWPAPEGCCQSNAKLVLLRKSGEHLLQQEVFYGTRNQVYDGVQARGGSPGVDQWPGTS